MKLLSLVSPVTYPEKMWRGGKIVYSIIGLYVSFIEHYYNKDSFSDDPIKIICNEWRLGMRHLFIEFNKCYSSSQ